MLQLSPDQTLELARRREAAWLERLAEDLVRRFPQVAEVPRDELRQRLAADAKQLHAFGITVDSLVRRMLEWTALLGASFWCVPRYGWVGGALAHPEMGEREKVALIDGRLTLEAAGHRAES